MSQTQHLPLTKLRYLEIFNFIFNLHQKKRVKILRRSLTHLATIVGTTTFTPSYWNCAPFDSQTRRFRQAISSGDLNKRSHPAISSGDLNKRSHPAISSGDLIQRSHQAISPGDLIQRSHPAISPGDLIQRSHHAISPSDLIQRSHQAISTGDSIRRSHRVISSNDLIWRSHQAISSSDLISTLFCAVLMGILRAENFTRIWEAYLHFNSQSTFFHWRQAGT